jgi:hypothetical protein
MKTVILILVIIAAIAAIASGIWVAIALGSETSVDKKKEFSSDSIEENS